MNLKIKEGYMEEYGGGKYNLKNKRQNGGDMLWEISIIYLAKHTFLGLKERLSSW